MLRFQWIVWKFCLWDIFVLGAKFYFSLFIFYCLFMSLFIYFLYHCPQTNVFFYVWLNLIWLCSAIWQKINRLCICIYICRLCIITSHTSQPSSTSEYHLEIIRPPMCHLRKKSHICWNIKEVASLCMPFLACERADLFNKSSAGQTQKRHRLSGRLVSLGVMGTEFRASRYHSVVIFEGLQGSSELIPHDTERCKSVGKWYACFL